jgi:DNA invertase Pin-like site-specific DNA recombinase
LKYGYTRVSTKGQAVDGNSLEAQEKILREHGAEIIFTDTFTGTKLERPEFDKLLKLLQPGDSLLCSKLDRLSRSVSQASSLITELINKNITVDICNLGILSNDSVNTLMRNVLLSFAQFERDMIVERTQEGKAIARQNPSFRDGRPRKFKSEQRHHAIELLNSGRSYRDVENLTGISLATLFRIKKEDREKEILKET